MSVRAKAVPENDETNESLAARFGSGFARFGRQLVEMAFVVMPAVVGWKGGISRVYEWAEGYPTTLAPHELFLFDKVGGLALSACFALFVASWEFKRMRKELEQQGKKLEKRIVESLKIQYADLFPSIEKLMSDAESYRECKKTVDVIANLFVEKTLTQRVIMRGVVAGHRDRIRATAEGLSRTGIFMDVEERRELTEELFEQEKSYVVFVKGFHHISKGPFSWHKEYLRFLRSASGHVAWVYVGDEQSRLTREAKEAIKAVTADIKIPCYFSQPLDGGRAGQPIRLFWENAGPLIEVFGSEVPVALKKKKDIPTGSEIAWKTTQLCYRGGAKIAPEQATVLDFSGAVERAAGLSVWSSEEVSKLIRASGVRVGGDLLSQALQHICKAAVPVHEA